MSERVVRAWKIVETDNGEDMKTLFHGVNGTKTIAPGKWITAVEKMVKDGTSKTKYLSGWHVLLSEQEAHDYLKAFTKRLEKLKVIEVFVKGLRPKEHSRSDVFLAKELMLPA